jgi:hypothetical protein
VITVDSRYLPSAILLAGSLASAIAATVPRSGTWQGIWIGAAFTALAAGLVDISAVFHERRHERIARAVAARRLSATRRRLEQLVRLMFDVPPGDGLLKHLTEMDPPTAIDLTGRANVVPPRSKQEFALQLQRMVVDELEVLTSFAATGIYTEVIGVLDQIMHSSSFGSLAREMITMQAYIRMGDEARPSGR